jgi:hypothetical protein
MRWRRAVAGAIVLLTATVASAALGRTLAANVLGVTFVAFWTLWGAPHPAIASADGGAC